MSFASKNPFLSNSSACVTPHVFDPRKQQLRELREQDKRRQEERRLEEERQKRLRETHGEPVLSEPKPEKSVKAESPKPEVQKEVGFQVWGGEVGVRLHGCFLLLKVMKVMIMIML